MKIVAIHDAQPVIYREDGVSQAGEILIFSVGVVVVVHVMEAEQHLPAWSAMREDQRGTTSTLVARHEKLSVDRVSIAALEGHLLRHNKLGRGKVFWQSIFCHELPSRVGNP